MAEVWYVELCTANFVAAGTVNGDLVYLDSSNYYNQIPAIVAVCIVHRDLAKAMWKNRLVSLRPLNPKDYNCWLLHTVRYHSAPAWKHWVTKPKSKYVDCIEDMAKASLLGYNSYRDYF